jgi:hypothetical protein
VHFCLQPYALFTLVLPLHIIYLLHLLSTNHKCTQSCYFPYNSNLLLRRRRWTGILQWGILWYALPWLPFLWCYGVFQCFISLKVVWVFKDIIYVIIILYIRDIWLFVSAFGRMCGTIVPGSCIRWVLGFGINRVWHHAMPGRSSGPQTMMTALTRTLTLQQDTKHPIEWWHTFREGQQAWARPQQANAKHEVAQWWGKLTAG